MSSTGDTSRPIERISTGIEGLDESPQEFAAGVKREIEKHDTSIVMTDGIAGYGLTLQGDESDAVRRLHALVAT